MQCQNGEISKSSYSGGRRSRHLYGGGQLSARDVGVEHEVLTALVEFIRSVVTETVRACGLQEPKDEANSLHQRQEGCVC